jgi:hypothetical protein
MAAGLVNCRIAAPNTTTGKGNLAALRKRTLLLPYVVALKMSGPDDAGIEDSKGEIPRTSPP